MAQGNYSTSAFLKIAFNTARGKEGEGTIRPEIAGEDETVGCSLRSRLSPPRVKKGLRASPPLSLSLYLCVSLLSRGWKDEEDGRESKPGVEWPKRRVKRRGGERNKGRGKRERGRGEKKMAQTGSRGQERRVDKGKRRRGGREEIVSRRGVATGQRGWISFRLVPLMSVMRAAGPLLPF